MERQPSFSPDGSQVAFSWDGEKQDNFDIYVKMIGSGTPLRLTTHASLDFSPAWSPDGRQIAFLRVLPDGRAAVLVIPALGGSERKLAESSPQYDFQDDTPLSGLGWSPDSKWIAFSIRDSPAEPNALFLLSLETGERRRLTTPPPNSAGDGTPAFSPDGRTLVFSRGGVIM